jgi:threonine/homoserine/homoserine lactone efflux protein
MDIDLFLALTAFAMVAAITPGPNNLMLLASGINFGFAPTLPHLLGTGFGFMLMILLIGVGLGQVFAAFPLVYTALKYLGAAYLLWLAWKIAQSGPVGEAGGKARPMRFIDAAAFQWVNPKGWVAAVTAVTNYAVPGQPLLTALVVAGVFGLAGFPSTAAWVFFGAGLRRILNDPKKLRAFNWTMAALLVLSLVPVLRG